MAKFAFMRPGPDDGAPTPLSGHPAFPFVVSAWFATLLGIGSLLLPVILFERLVEMAGLPGFIPATAPPLGGTARLAIAVASGAFGALLGFAVARRVANAHSSPAERRLARLDPDARKPMSVFEVMPAAAPDVAGDVELDDDLIPFMIPRHPAPVDAGPERIVDADWELVPELVPPAHRPLPEFEPAEAEADVAADMPGEAAPAIDWRVTEQPYEGPEMTEIHDSWPDPDLGQWQFPAGPEADAATGDAALEDIGIESLAAPGTPVDDPEMTELPAIAMPDMTIDPDLPALEGLSLPELVQRLALTIERRREWIAAIRTAAVEVPATAPAFEAAPADEAAQAMAAWFGSPSLGAMPLPHIPGPDPVQEFAMDAGLPAGGHTPPLLRPAFLDWFEHGEEDEDAPLPSLNLPRRDPAFMAPVFDTEEESLDAEADSVIEDEDAYGSLIGMKNPFAPQRSDFIRIDDEESAEFVDGELEDAEESQEKPDPAQTDAALRAALASLQRISGAA